MQSSIAQEAGVMSERRPSLVTTLADLAETVDVDLSEHIRSFASEEAGSMEQPSESAPLPRWQSWIDSLPIGSMWRSDTSGDWRKLHDGMHAPDGLGMSGLAVSVYYVRNSAPYSEVQS